MRIRRVILQQMQRPSPKFPPWITANDEIILELMPEVSDFVNTSGSGKAATSKKSANTTIRAKDGEMIVIGGLVKRTEADASDKFPILGNIPVIGNLFSQKSKTDDASELVFYIRPRIMSKKKIMREVPKIEEPLINWENFKYRKNKRYLKSGLKNLLWTGAFVAGSLYLNEVSVDYHNDYKLSGSQSDRDNARYFGIGRDVTAGIACYTFSIALYDLTRYTIGKFKVKKHQK